MRTLLCTLTLAFFCALFAPQQAQAQYGYCSYGIAWGTSYTWQSGGVVYGYSSTELDYCAGLWYDPETFGLLSEGDPWSESNRTLVSAYATGYADIDAADIEFWYTAPRHNEFYSTESIHYVREVYQAYGCFAYCGYYWYDPWGWGFSEGYGGPSFYGYGGAGYWSGRRRRLGNTLHTIQYRSFSCQSGNSFTETGEPCQTPTPTPVPTATPPTATGISLSSTGAQEVGKTTHFLALKDSGNVTITATLTPATADPAGITWTGGTAGPDNRRRLVSTAAAGNTDVTATVGLHSATVRIHVVDATAAPAAAIDAPKTFTNGGAANTGTAFGRVVVTIGEQGVTRPTFNINPHLNSDRWVFRVKDIAHSYRLGINAHGRIDLPVGNPTPFPQAAGMTLMQSYQEARDDLDTAGLVAIGPRRRSYWVEHITQTHEEAHVARFYSAAFWLDAMGAFERDDVEATTVHVIYDCNDATTTTGPNAVNKLLATWQTAITNRHSAADTAEITGSEAHAHGVSNPLYVPIRNQIPTSTPTPPPTPTPTPPPGPTPPIAQFPRNAEVVRVDAPLQMEAGYSYDVSVTLVNRGSITWNSAEGYRLGSMSPHDNFTWGTHRIELPGPVPTNGEVTFNFVVTAPYTPGFYNFQWGMLQEGVTWFGAYPENLVIYVTQPPGFCYDQWAEQNCYNRGGWWDTYSCSCNGGWQYDY